MRRYKKGLLVALILIAVICIALAVVSGREYSTVTLQKSPAYLKSLLRYDDWKLVRENGTLQATELPAYKPVSNTQKVVLWNVLPKTLENGTYLAFESLNTYVTVKVDGEIIYTNLTDTGKRAMAMWNLVPLESPQAEGQLFIELFSREPYDMSVMPGIYMGPKSEILLLVDSESTRNQMVSVSVVILGLLVFLFSTATFANDRFVRDFIILGLFIMILGISQLWQVTTTTQSLRSSYIRQCIAISAFGILPAYYCYYRSTRTQGQEGGHYTAAASVYLGFFLLIFLCHWFLPVAGLPPMRTIIYLMMELAYGYCLYCTLFKETTEDWHYRWIISASLAVLMLCAGIEGFTPLTYTGNLPIKPMIVGALAFSLLQAVAVVLSAYNYVEQQLRLSEELSESRVKLMVNQMRPHFIRSALGAIRSIIKNDPEKAYSLLYDFTNYLSFNIETLDNLEPVLFREELRHIKEYVVIEQERFYPRVRMEYEIETDSFMVPPLSVQPFVENAIKHGILAKRDGGTVRLITEETENAYIVTVSDNGGGFDTTSPPPTTPSHGISSKNASYRLESMVGASVQTQSELGKGTTITITIPKKEEQKSENDFGR